MRVPESLDKLVDQGIVQEVIRPLLSGKEAQIYLVMAEDELRVAKIYKASNDRTFKHRSTYTEGRKVRNSRDQRAMGKRTSYGRQQEEAKWRSTEVDMIYRLRAADVRVPEPHHFIDGVLLMELVTDAHGQPAPRLADVEMTATASREVLDKLLREIVKMLCAGVVHGDLSDFNVLIGRDGPVIIDFPQSVDAAHNQNARSLLLRDVRNIVRSLGRFSKRYKGTHYGEEMWDLYERSELLPQTELTGEYQAPKQVTDTRSLLEEIAEIEREAQERRVAMGLPAVRPARQPRPVEAAPVKAQSSGERDQVRQRSGRRRSKHRGDQAQSSHNAGQRGGGRPAGDRTQRSGQAGTSGSDSPASRKRPGRGQKSPGGAPQANRGAIGATSSGGGRRSPPKSGGANAAGPKSDGAAPSGRPRRGRRRRGGRGAGESPQE